MKRSTLMKKLNRQFGIISKTSTEFYGHESDGIWIQDTGEVSDTELPAFDSEAWSWDTEEHIYKMGVHVDVLDILDEAGWYAEPHDSETWMIYPI